MGWLTVFMSSCLPGLYIILSKAFLLSAFGGGGLVAKSCPTLVTPWTVAHQAPLVHGISQARVLEWVAISFSRGSSRPRDQTLVSCIGRWILYH